MANEFVARKGLIVSGSTVMTGSLKVSGGITGSLSGTATSASYASTASLILGTVASSSYANNADLLDGLNSTVFATTGSNTFIGNQRITGSVNILSGSVSSSGPTSGFYTINGVNDFRIVPNTGGWIEVGSNTTNLFIYAGGHIMTIANNLIQPSNDNTYGLGGSGNRWGNGYINRLFSSGSITLTGSLNILSGSINITNGGITSSLFGTSSWASNTISSSFSTTASAATSITFTPTTASFASTASFVNTLLQNVSASGNISAGGNLQSNTSVGDEGGQIDLARPQTNTSISGSIAIDVYQNKIRIFEQNSPNRGGYWDITSLASGVGTNFSSLISSSYAATASLLLGSIQSASFATTASAATSITFAPSTASFSTTASAATSITFTPNSASFATTSSAANSITFTPATASFATTASAATSITFTPSTASFANTSSFAVSTPFSGVTGKPTLVSASSQIDHNQTTNYVANQHIDHSTVSISAGSGLSGGGDITATRTVSLDTSSAHFTGGVKTKLNIDGVWSSSAQLPVGTVSSSVQVDVRNTTGIATLATTGSNTFTGVQTISNTTNSTAFNNGALIVQGGVGITKDVYISGGLNVTGLLTAVSMSTQYVTSSQYVVGDNRIILNSDDVTRFGGMSIRDSGSSSATASLYWDSLNHRFIYENISGAPYNSAVIIAGPKNTGTLGNEVGLIVGRIPVATGDDHIDTALASSSLRIDFVDGKTHIEKGLHVTGSITSSVGFSGSGTNITGVISSSFATTSSAATSITFTPSTASFATTASAATSITFVPVTASYAQTASFATTASAATSITFTPSTASFASTAPYSGLTGVPVGIVSSSGQVSYTGLSNIPSGIVSSSTQVTTLLPTGTVSSSTQINYTQLQNIPSGIVSSSGQVSYTGLSNIPSGIVSSSTQVTTLLPTGTVSSSLQISTGSFTGSFIGTHSGSTFGTSSWAVSSSFATSASWAPGGAGTVGPGTTNSLAFFNASSTVSSSNVFQSSNNIGINTSTPNRQLSVNGNANITGSLDVTAAFTAQTKSFRIDHQRLPGKSLIYGVLEGPEHAVFCRGKLIDTDTILLPDEWEWLVDVHSITVQLTPIGRHQKLYVDEVTSTHIIIGNDNIFNSDIECYYTVFATRKDVEPLQVIG